MRVMVLVKATKESEAGQMPDQALLEKMSAYNEELGKAGIMLQGDGLKPNASGKRIRFSGTERTVTDGPFSGSNDLVSGFWIWQVKSIEDAMAWLKRAPFDHGAEIELRPIVGTEHFGAAMTPELRQREEDLHTQLGQKK